jgi:hypothetical protein
MTQIETSQALTRKSGMQEESFKAKKDNWKKSKGKQPSSQGKDVLLNS